MDLKLIAIFVLAGAVLGALAFVPAFFLADVFVGMLLVGALGGGVGYFIEHQKAQTRVKQPTRHF